MALNVELLESSFAPVKSNGSEFAQRFYTVLFADYPEAQPLFANTHMEKQSQQLFQSLVFTIDHLREPEKLGDALKGLGTRHIKYGVLPQHYPIVGSSLLKTLAATLDTAWTPAVQEAWTDAYGAITQLMLEGANYPPELLNLSGAVE
jgi:hemoglobin-like flavoprotein